MNLPETRRPDEDRLSLPAKWRRHVLPRRGHDLENTAFDTAVDPGASEAVAHRIAEKRPLFDQWLAKSQDDGVAAAVAAHLEGRPDPLGAAAVMHLVETTKRRRHEYIPVTIPTAARLQHLDAWIADHGLPFAAAALIEAAIVYNRTYATDDRRISEGRLERPWRIWMEDLPAAARLCSLLASAPEAEYRAAVAAVDARRTDNRRRICAAVLMPTEADWIADAAEAARRDHTADDWVSCTIAAGLKRLDLIEGHRLDSRYTSERTLAPLVEGFGPDALPALTQAVGRGFERMTKPARDAVITAIGLVPSDEATAFLLDKPELPGVVTAVMDHAERFPHRMLRVVAARAAETGTRARLADIVRSSPALLAALPEIDEPTRETLAALLDTSDSVPEAAAEALPPLLVDPPWKSKRRKPVVIDGLTPSLEARVVWADADEQRHWATIGDDDPYARYEGESLQRKLDFFEQRPDYDYLMTFLAWADIEHAEPLLDRWKGSASDYVHGRELKRLLGRFGPRVVDRVTPFLKGRTSNAEVLIPIQSLDAARIAAEWLARSKTLAPVAKRWFDRHADAAAHLLVPDALGGEAGLRRAAFAALRHLRAFHGAEPVTAAAKPYGEAAAEAIGALVTTDPLDPLDAKIPKPPAWAAPAMLPQVLLKGREAALPAAAVEHLTTALALDTLELPYPGVDVITETCDAASLTHFSWKLFELWTDADSPSKDGWAFTQLARFADDDTVRRLTALVRRWPGERQHKRAVTGLRILGAIGSETSLRAIDSIARKVGFKALKQEAGEQIEAVAERLGLTTEQLADRIVPDFGLDDATSLVLDYGPRRFTVGFDERLKPFVTDANGKALKTLPKPGAQDDAAAAEAAYQRFSHLKKDLAAVAKEQVRRLEHAMVAGRTWTAAEFREFLADHPLMRHLTRRLVWLAETADGPTGFRLAEDRTFTDVEDDEWTLPEAAQVRVAHPVALGERLAAWSEVFADYEIVQPFAQLARPVMDFTEDELRSGRITRFDGATIKSGSVLGLAKWWGWRRGNSNGVWVEPGFHRPLPAGGYVVVSLDPGIEAYMGRVDSAQIQTVRSVHLSPTADYASPGAGGGHPTDIDPVTASEILYTLARSTAPA